jgi:hypothetical protein
MLLSASRDKTLIIWNLTRDETQYGYPKRSLHGHSHIVSDCVRYIPNPTVHFITMRFARMDRIVNNHRCWDLKMDLKFGLRLGVEKDNAVY